MSAEAAGYQFCALPGLYAVCRLAARSPVPAWVTGDFVCVTATSDEVSIMCPAERPPRDVQAERDWRVVKILGPFPLNAVGVLSALAAPLAAAGISVLAVATYDTDYVLVKADALDRAIAALTQAGHRLAN